MIQYWTFKLEMRMSNSFSAWPHLAGQTWQERDVPPPNCQLGGEAIFLNIFTNTYCMIMNRCALESPDLGQAFTYLGRYHITHRKFSRATWSRKVSQKLMKVRNFESLSWLWRVKFCIFQLFRSVASSLRIVWSWFNVRWRVLILGKLLNTLGVILSPIEIFLEPVEVEKFLKNLMKVRKVPYLIKLSKLFWKIRNNQNLPDVFKNSIRFFKQFVWTVPKSRMKLIMILLSKK